MEKIASEIEIWDAILSAFLNSTCDIDMPRIEKDIHYENAIDTLKVITASLIKQSKVKDTFEMEDSHILLFNTAGITIKSNKMDVTFGLDLSPKGFELATYFDNPPEFKTADPVFWKSLLLLNTYDSFKFEHYAGEINSSSKSASTIYNLIKEHIAIEDTGEECCNFGQLSVSFFCQKTIEEVLGDMLEVFRAFYKLHYFSYRQHYIRKKTTYKKATR